jgi:DNA primase
MNIDDSRLNCQQLNQQDLVDYLDSLGFTPTKIRNADYWYRSPLRNERTPSFKVNRKLNVWFDYGTGNGGKLIDFGIEYFKCSVKELLDKVSGRLYLPFTSSQIPQKQTAPEQPRIRILSDNDLHSPSLIRYIKHRRVAENVAQAYCREIMFEI